MEGLDAAGWSRSSMPMVARTYAHLEQGRIDEKVRAADAGFRALRKNYASADEPGGNGRKQRVS